MEFTILERRLIQQVRALGLDPKAFVDSLEKAVAAADDFAAAERDFRAAMLSFCTGASDRAALDAAGEGRRDAQVHAAFWLAILTGRATPPTGGNSVPNLTKLPDRDDDAL